MMANGPCNISVYSKKLISAQESIMAGIIYWGALEFSGEDVAERGRYNWIKDTGDVRGNNKREVDGKI